MNNDYFQMYYANEKIERYRHEAEIERMLNQVKKNQLNYPRLPNIRT